MIALAIHTHSGRSLIDLSGFTLQVLWFFCGLSRSMLQPTLIQHITQLGHGLVDILSSCADRSDRASSRLRFQSLWPYSSSSSSPARWSYLSGLGLELFHFSSAPPGAAPGIGILIRMISLSNRCFHAFFEFSYLGIGMVLDIAQQAPLLRGYAHSADAERMQFFQALATLSGFRHLHGHL
jgi:hypothetical protein